jgi:hypothetical protein
MLGTLGEHRPLRVYGGALCIQLAADHSSAKPRLQSQSYPSAKTA